MAYSRDPRDRWKWAIGQVLNQVRDDILMRDQYGFGLEKNYGDEDGFSVNVRPPTAETYASFTNRRFSPVPKSAESRPEVKDSQSPIRKKSIFSANIFQRRKTVLSASKKDEGKNVNAPKVSTYEKINKLKRIYYWIFGIICFSYIVSSIVLKNEKTSFKPIPVLSPVESNGDDTVTMLSVELRTQEGSHRAWGDVYITTFDNRMGFIDDNTWTKNEVRNCNFSKKAYKCNCIFDRLMFCVSNWVMALELWVMDVEVFSEETCPSLSFLK